MRKRFAGRNNIVPLVLLIVFLGLPTLVFLATEKWGMVLFFGIAAFVAFLVYASNFRAYVVTDNEFSIVDIYGNKTDSVLFDNMVKIYTLKGYATWGSDGPTGLNVGPDYVASGMLKIQTKSGELFRIELDDVWDAQELMDALREQLGEHMFHPGPN